MLRPPRPEPIEPMESDDSGSVGGLADMLEPDDPDAITSLRLVGAASIRTGAASIRTPPASMRNPPISVRGGGGPVSERTRAPIQVQDFAFADTVFGLPDEPAPPSHPIFVNDAPPDSPSQLMTPLAFPVPSSSERPGPVTTGGYGPGGFTLSAIASAFARSREEMRELWAGTAEMVDGNDAGATQIVRRVFALWSCFQWSRADLTRAALIGVLVFGAAAALGATTMDLGDASSSSGVRAPRTLDQHTSKKGVVHAKR